jgi:hypothetical protein
MPYRILLTTPLATKTLDPALIPGIPAEPPVVMAELVMALLGLSYDELQHATLSIDGLYGALNLEHDRILHETLSSEAFYRLCTVRVVPTTTITAPVEALTAVIEGADGLERVHVELIKALRVKLRTVQTEVTEALAALDRWDAVAVPAGSGEVPVPYLPPMPEAAINAILRLTWKGRDSTTFHLRDLMPGSARSALQLITHELTKADDGVGHTMFDSTAAQLILEHEGAEAGDQHEQMLHAALLKPATPEPAPGYPEMGKEDE